MRNAAGPLTLLLLLGACSATNAGDGYSRDDLVWGKLGQRVFVDGLAVIPREVIEDSRCPTDVRCAWAGQVRILATVRLSPRDAERELISGKPVPVADGSLELADVLPAANSGKAIVPEDYRFGFRFGDGL